MTIEQIEENYMAARDEGRKLSRVGQHDKADVKFDECDKLFLDVVKENRFLNGRLPKEPQPTGSWMA
jgi:hypothetical protein